MQQLVTITGARRRFIGSKLFVITMLALICTHTIAREDWTQRELALIDSLRLANLPPAPVPASNMYAASKPAARLGELLFNDPRFSSNGEISCSQCHRAEYDFTDTLPTAKGIGQTNRRSMPLSGLAYQRWFFWDGRADSLWAQALEPLENPLEHGIHRLYAAQLMARYYKEDYESALEPFPAIAPKLLSDSALAQSTGQAEAIWDNLDPRDKADITRVFVNMGKAIAAYVATLIPGPSRFDEFADALIADRDSSVHHLTPSELAGLKLFIGRGRCINCHNGPMLSDGEFHHVAVADKGDTDFGRIAVAQELASREFSCISQWSDASPNDCVNLKYAKFSPLESFRAFKTPTLRNVALRPPYMHAGQFSDLLEVITNYQVFSGNGRADEIFHNDLSDTEQLDLVAFLKTLSTIK